VRKFAPRLFTRSTATSSRSAPGRFEPGAGEAELFRQQVLPHLDSAYNLARYLTRDPVLSEDIVQDALLRAFRAFGTFRGESPRAWLLAIVRNCSRSALANTAARPWTIHESSLSDEDSARFQSEADPDPGPDDRLIRDDEIKSLRSAIAAIPEPFREAVVLRDMEDLSYAEISELTGVAIGTVMSRISRGRSMLAKQLLPAADSAAEQSRSAK
jgi:RNA polymerase sigma-70 factor (ECF subfamily)